MSEVEQCDNCGKIAPIMYFGDENHSFCSEPCMEAYELEHAEDDDEKLRQHIDLIAKALTNNSYSATYEMFPCGENVEAVRLVLRDRRDAYKIGFEHDGNAWVVMEKATDAEYTLHELALFAVILSYLNSYEA